MIVALLFLVILASIIACVGGGFFLVLLCPPRDPEQFARDMEHYRRFKRAARR